MSDGGRKGGREKGREGREGVGNRLGGAKNTKINKNTASGTVSAALEVVDMKYKK